MGNILYLVGDVRFTEEVDSLFENNVDVPTEFLLKLQKVMEDYGVVKIDVSIDAIKYSTIKNENNNKKQ